MAFSFSQLLQEIQIFLVAEMQQLANDSIISIDKMLLNDEMPLIFLGPC